MKAAMVGAPGRVEMVDVPRPVPQDGEVLVKLRCCGVCGTDVEKVHGDATRTKILGHEVVGEVEQVRGVKGLEPGMRVFTHHHVPCYACELCVAGRYTYCAEFQRSNLSPCGLAESYLVPKFNVDRGAILALPDHLSFEDASFIEPLACCILGLDKARARSASSALIYGAGPVGLLHMKLLQRSGMERVAVADVSENRLEFARRTGASAAFDPSQPGDKAQALSRLASDPELVILATGSHLAFEDAIRTVAKGGRVLLFGAPRKGETTSFDLSGFFFSGAEVVTSYSASERETNAALELLAQGEMRVGDLVTHRFPLAETGAAFEAAIQQKCVKALIVN